MRRCGRNARKKPVERALGNGVRVNAFDLATLSVDVDVFVDKSGESYFNFGIGIGEFGPQVLLTPHGSYVENETFYNTIVSYRDSAGVFLIMGLDLDGNASYPFDGRTGTYTDEFVELAANLYLSPTEENVQAFVDFLDSLEEDITKLPLHRDSTRAPLTSLSFVEHYEDLPVYIGEHYYSDIAIIPDSPVYVNDITVTSSRPNEIVVEGVAYVNANIRVTLRLLSHRGKVTLTARSSNGLEDSCVLDFHREITYKTRNELLAMGDDSTPVVAELNRDAIGYAANLGNNHVFQMTMENYFGIEGLTVTAYVLTDSAAHGVEEVDEKVHIRDGNHNAIMMTTTKTPELLPQEMHDELFPEGYTRGMRYAQYPG